MQLIAKIIRRKKATEAIELLSQLPKAAARMMSKVVKSALANATKNAGAKEEALIVSRVEVGRGPKLKRMRFASRSKTHAYTKHRSFVKVILDTKE